MGRGLFEVPFEHSDPNGVSSAAKRMCRLRLPNEALAKADQPDSAHILFFTFFRGSRVSGLRESNLAGE